MKLVLVLGLFLGECYGGYLYSLTGFIWIKSMG